MKSEQTKVVKIHDVNIDKDYIQWLNEIKVRYHQAQIKAAIRVNAEKLLFNWELGRDLVQKKAEEKWGAGIVEQVSLDLQDAFPGEKGFSPTNLWRMKQWYLFYTDKKNIEKVREFSPKLAQLGQETPADKQLAQVGREFPRAFAFVPWRHHVEILIHCKTIDEALFYIAKTIEHGWSRDDLANCIKGRLFDKAGGAITNFADKLPTIQGKLAQEITKSNYDFSFATLPDGYDEDALESELEHHLTRFLLELGTGFAYLGRQKEIIVAGKTRKIDMLFFHIHLNCYIVIELKVVPFKPEFAGKLNFYVNAVDDLIKTSAQNPTIGLLICSNKDETEVQYAFNGITTPMGVASYDNVRIKEIQEQLPSIEELKARIRLLEETLDKKR